MNAGCNMSSVSWAGNSSMMFTILLVIVNSLQKKKKKKKSFNKYYEFISDVYYIISYC